MEQHAFEVYNVISDDKRTVIGLASVFDVGIDEGWGGKSIIHRGAFKKTIQQRSKQIRHLWQHDAASPPIATVRDIQEVGRKELPPQIREQFPEATGGLMVTRAYLNTPRGNEILEALSAEPPAISEMSIGFEPIKFDFDDDGEEKNVIRHLREVRLWDTSDVNWGANPATMASMCALPYRDTGKCPEGEAWNEPTLSEFTADPWESLTDNQKRRVAGYYAWVSDDPAHDLSDLKLLHHKAQRVGIGPVVWQGVQMAMQSLLGLHGNIDIPYGDRQAVYEHLAGHYREFHKEPPAMAMANLLWDARIFLRDNQEKMNAVFTALGVEPPSAFPPANDLTARIEIAKRKAKAF